MRVANAEEQIQYYVDRFDMARFLNGDLLARLELFRFPAYTNIYVAQDEQHYLYFLVEGQAQCNHYHLNGKLAVIALSNPFSAIGDFEILSEERVFSNVIATQDTVMLGIARNAVERYGAEDPSFLRFLIDQLREKLYQTNALQLGNVLPVINRLAVHLLAQPARGDDPGDLLLPDKEVLASLLGVTPRHLNRVLKELGESGCVSVADYPRVRIVDRQALQDLAE